MSTPETLQVRVRAVTYEAEGILGFELVPMPPLKELPPFTAGSHIDLHLPNGLLRSYSLLNAPHERHRYLIGVNKDAQSRGGSRYLHEVLHAGDTLAISAPRNNFLLDETASLNVFIAGGIGITPLMSMIARSQALGTPWKLHYAARTRRHAAFLETLHGYHNDPSVELSFNFDQEPDSRRLDLSRPRCSGAGAAPAAGCARQTDHSDTGNRDRAGRPGSPHPGEPAAQRRAESPRLQPSAPSEPHAE